MPKSIDLLKKKKIDQNSNFFKFLFFNRFNSICTLQILSTKWLRIQSYVSTAVSHVQSWMRHCRIWKDISIEFKWIKTWWNTQNPGKVGIFRQNVDIFRLKIWFLLTIMFKTWYEKIDYFVSFHSVCKTELCDSYKWVKNSRSWREMCSNRGLLGPALGK